MTLPILIGSEKLHKVGFHEFGLKDQRVFSLSRKEGRQCGDFERTNCQICNISVIMTIYLIYSSLSFLIYKMEMVIAIW